MAYRPSTLRPASGLSITEPLQRRGRPRDPERIRRILEAARTHFHTHGFEGANLDSIARDATVSKMTIYSHFASKEGLFEAVIGSQTDGVVAAQHPGNVKLNPLQPKAALEVVGAQFLSLIRDEDTIGQFRTMYSAAASQPEACSAFYRQGPERLINELAEYLLAAQSAGSLSVQEPRQAANLFLSLFLGDGHIRSLLRLRVPTRLQDKAMLHEAVRVFMAAFCNNR